MRLRWRHGRRHELPGFDSGELFEITEGAELLLFPGVCVAVWVEFRPLVGDLEPPVEPRHEPAELGMIRGEEIVLLQAVGAHIEEGELLAFGVEDEVESSVVRRAYPHLPGEGVPVFAIPPR